jgi:hypothetical protein
MVVGVGTTSTVGVGGNGVGDGSGVGRSAVGAGCRAVAVGSTVGGALRADGGALVSGCTPPQPVATTATRQPHANPARREKGPALVARNLIQRLTMVELGPHHEPFRVVPDGG